MPSVLPSDVSLARAVPNELKASFACGPAKSENFQSLVGSTTPFVSFRTLTVLAQTVTVLLADPVVAVSTVTKDAVLS